MSKFLKLIVAASLILTTNGWDLSLYNISGSYYVSSIAVSGNFAFLALPRSSCYNNISSPTLLEVSWLSEQQSAFARKKHFLSNYQNWGNCDHIQDAISLDLEPLKARLWILDKGNDQCPPKIVVHSFFKKTITAYNLTEVSRDKLNFLVVDSFGLNSRAYVGLKGLNLLLVFSLNEMTQLTLKLKSLLPVSTAYLAIDPKQTTLFISGEETTQMFSLSLQKLRSDFDNEISTTTVGLIGEKLGVASGLVVDYKEGLSYYLIRDYAVVRWDMRNPSQAEYYNVLAQSYQILPYVSQLFTGPRKGIWALVNPGSPNQCGNKSVLPRLERRAVKLLKYNPFV